MTKLGIQGPTSPGSLYKHLGDAGLFTAPSPQTSPANQSNSCKCKNPEGPLAHQSRDYKPQVPEVKVELSIKEICNRTAKQAKALMTVKLSKEDREELEQAIGQYTLNDIVKDFALLSKGLDQKTNTVSQSIKAHNGIFAEIAEKLNKFYSKIIPKK